MFHPKIKPRPVIVISLRLLHPCCRKSLTGKAGHLSDSSDPMRKPILV
jgi:hypothetical protein